MVLLLLLLQAQRVLKEVHLPNSYTLTKHMCEDLLAELHCKTFPVCINRPTIIGAIANLPVPGYFGNAAGLTSATLAFATGAALFMLLKLTFAADVSCTAEMCGGSFSPAGVLSRAGVREYRPGKQHKRLCRKECVNAIARWHMGPLQLSDAGALC